MHRMNFDGGDEGEGGASPAAGPRHRAPVSALVAANGLISQNFKLLNLFVFAQTSEDVSTPPPPTPPPPPRSDRAHMQKTGRAKKERSG